MLKVTSFVALITASLSSVPPAWAEEADAMAVYEKKCKVCHSLGGEGGKLAEKGGPLDEVGSKHDAEWLRAYLVDPKSKIEDAKMPALKYSDAELDALVAWLVTLQ